MTAEIEGLANAQAGYTAAVAKRDALLVRVADAEVALSKVTAARADMVNRVAEGYVSTPKQLAEITNDIRSAEHNLTFLRDAVAASERAIKSESDKIAEVMHAEGLRQFELAKVRRIKAAERLDELGALFGEAAAEFEAAGDAISDSWKIGRPPVTHEAASLGERRRIGFALPMQVQHDIIQTGSAYHISLANSERSTWRLTQAV